MSKVHKDALARGRSSARTIRAYLEAIRATKPARGRRRTPDSIRKQLGAIEGEYASASAMRTLELAQRRMDLAAELAKIQDGDRLGDLQREFVKIAKSYAVRKGISRKAFREVGVPAAVLDEAGIK